VKEFDCAGSDLRCSRTVGETDLLATWSDPDSPEAVVKARNNCIKIGDHETLKSRSSRLYCTIKFVARKHKSIHTARLPTPNANRNTRVGTLIVATIYLLLIQN